MSIFRNREVLSSEQTDGTPGYDLSLVMPYLQAYENGEIVAKDGRILRPKQRTYEDGIIPVRPEASWPLSINQPENNGTLIQNPAIELETEEANPEIETDSQLELEPQLITTSSVVELSKPTTEIYPASNKIDFGRLTVKGLTGAAKLLKKTGQSANDSLDNLKYLPSVVATGFIDRYFGLPEKADKHKDLYKKVAVGLGGIALSAAAGYLVYKGLAHSPNPQRLHEVAPPTPTKSITTAHEVLPSQPVHHIAAESVVRHADRVAENFRGIKVNLGDGYTQVLAKVFPDHSANTYLNGYKEAIQKLGPNFIKGIHHYRMSDSSWGFRGTGRAELTKKSIRLLTQYFNSHQ